MTFKKNTLRIALLSLSAAAAIAHAEDFDAYAWYVPYHNLLRADLTLPKDLRTPQHVERLGIRLQLRSAQNAVVFDRTVAVKEVNPLPPAAPGGYDWQENISFKPFAANWTDSWVDFAVHYQQKLITLAGVNGTWFDNQSCFTIDGYTDDGFEQRLLDNPKRWQPESGEHRAKNYGRPYHILQFRRYMKRLAQMCHASGVQPFWMVNQHPTWSFAQFAWHIEADFYCQNQERDLIEHMGIAGFRAHVNTQGGLIKRLHSSVKVSDQPLREGTPETLGVRISDATAFHRPGAKRTHTGMCLLHDIGMIGSDRLVLQTLDENFGFFDDDVRFEPYWSQDSAKADSDRIRISLFRNPVGNKTVAVVFNEKWSPHGLTTDFEVAESATVSDLENGEPLKDLDTRTPGLQTRLWIPLRDFRLLVWDN